MPWWHKWPGHQQSLYWLYLKKLVVTFIGFNLTSCFVQHISLSLWKTMVSPTQLCWRYHSLPLSHRYVYHRKGMISQDTWHNDNVIVKSEWCYNIILNCDYIIALCVSWDCEKCFQNINMNHQTSVNYHYHYLERNIVLYLLTVCTGQTLNEWIPYECILFRVFTSLSVQFTFDRFI